MIAPKHITKIEEIREGASIGYIGKDRYEISKKTTTSVTGNRSISLQARRVHDNDYISLNWYPQTANGTMKPCELPLEKCLAFLEEVEVEG